EPLLDGVDQQAAQPIRRQCVCLAEERQAEVASVLRALGWFGSQVPIARLRFGHAEVHDLNVYPSGDERQRVAERPVRERQALVVVVAEVQHGDWSAIIY